MAEDFNIKLSVDTSEARAELDKFKKSAANAVASTRDAMRKIIDISDSFSASNSIGQIRKLTNEIVKLKKAAGDSGVRILDSDTSLAKVVESALKPSKSKGKSSTEIKKLQKELSKIVAEPASNITEVTSLLESMRGVVASLSRPNKKAAKDAMDLRREVDLLRKEYTILSRQISSGAATPEISARKTQLESVIPKTQEKLAKAISASKPSGDMQRMLETAQRRIIDGTENLQNLLGSLVDFADSLDQTTTGAVSGAGQDLLSGNAVRSLSKKLESSTGGNNYKELVDSIVNEVVKAIVKPRMSDARRPLTAKQQAKLQGRESIRAYSRFDAEAFVQPDVSPTGSMNEIMSMVLSQMYPDRVTRGQGTAVVMKGYGEKLAKVISSKKPSKEQEGSIEDEIDSLTQVVVDAFEEMQKQDDEEKAAEAKGRRGAKGAEAAIKDAFTSMSVIEGDPDEQANNKEIEAYVRRLLKDISYGARGGKGGKRIGGTYSPVSWEQGKKGLEKTGGYEEGGWRAKDMNKGFFAVDELTAAQEGFQYAAVTAEQFAEAMLVAIEVFAKVDRLFPAAKLNAYSSTKVGEVKSPLPELTAQQLTAWEKTHSQTLKPGQSLKGAQQIFGENSAAKIISDLIDITNRGVTNPNIVNANDDFMVYVETYSEEFIQAFKKLSPAMQEFVALVEDFAILGGKIKASIPGPRGEMNGLGLGKTGPELNTLEQLFAGIKTDPTTKINKFTRAEWTAMHGTPAQWTKKYEGYTDSTGGKLYDPVPDYPKQEGKTYTGRNYPGSSGASVIDPLILKIGRELEKDFAAIFGGTIARSGGKNITVDPETFRPSRRDNALEMKAIDAFIANRRAFIDYVVQATNAAKIGDITTALPDIESAFDAGSMGRLRGSGATDITRGEIAKLAASYQAGHTTERSAYGIAPGVGDPYPRSAASRARDIYGGAGAKDAGKYTVDGIRSGLKDGTSALEAESKIIAETIIGAYEDEMDIKSPSRRMKKAGQDTLAGLEAGLDEGKVTLDAKGRELADSFHRGFTEQQRINAALRVQSLEKQGLAKPAAALRATMSTAPTGAAAEEASDAKEIAERNKEATRLIDALAGVEGALIAFDTEKTAKSGAFGVSMVGGTGRGDTTGIYHNMVVPPDFGANRHEADVLGLDPNDPTKALKKRVKGLGYGPENITDPGAQRKMAEDLAHLIKYAIDKNIPIAIHNLGYSDWNDVIKLMEKFKIDGSPAREAASRGLLIETQGTAKMAGVAGSLKLEELYKTLMGKGFGAYLRPGAGNVAKITDKGAVAHDPTIDASATLEIAFELKKILGEMGFQGKGVYGDIIKAIEGGWQGISQLVLGARTHAGPGFAKGSNQFRTKALSYSGLDGGLVPGTGTKVDPAVAMSAAQGDAKKAVTAAGAIDRLTREERNVQIQQRLNIIEELKSRLKMLLSNAKGTASKSDLARIRKIQDQINAQMADPTISKEWQRRVATSGGVRTNFRNQGGGQYGVGSGGIGIPVSSSHFNQEFDGEAKARSVASKKIQGQMKDEMSIMGNVERYNRKMMDSWISGRYALYDMANTYQQFSRAGMKVANFLKQAILLNAQYETSFTGVERVMQPLNDEIRGMRNELVKLTGELPVAFDELARISTLGGQMGINAQGITDFTKQVSEFGIVTGIATDEVASKFGSIAQLTHTATDPESFMKLGSAVAYTGINAVATDQEILTLTESIASATTQAGFAASETIGLATAMSSLRIAPEQARGVITRLFADINRAVQGGGQPLQAYAKHLGMTTDETKKLWKSDPQAFFKKMVENVKRSKNSTVALDALNIKETREVNTIQKLSENMAVYNKSMSDAAQAYKDGTFLAEAYGKTQDNIATKMTLLGNQFKLLQDNIGQALAPIVGPMLDAIKGITEGLGNIVSNPVGAFATRIGVAIAALTTIMLAYAAAKKKATASVLAFRTAQLAEANIGGSRSSGFKAFANQLLGLEVIVQRSNGRMEVWTKSALRAAQAAGELRIDNGPKTKSTASGNIDTRRADMQSTADFVRNKRGLQKATLDATNADHLAEIQGQKTRSGILGKIFARKAEAAATAASASTAVTASAAEAAAVDREIIAREQKIAALEAEAMAMQANGGVSASELAETEARVAATNTETAALRAQVVQLEAKKAAMVGTNAGPEKVTTATKAGMTLGGGLSMAMGAFGAISMVLGLVAAISEAIDATKIHLEEAGGGLASFREAIYADTRAWKGGKDVISTYNSTVTDSKPALADWATGLRDATGAQQILAGDVSTTKDEITKQTLALGDNAAAWLANAAASDVNIQKMFKQFYTVGGPGLGGLAEAAGTKISDIITAAISPGNIGHGAFDYVKANFNEFAYALGDRGPEVKQALLDIASSLDVTTAAGVENSKMVEVLSSAFTSATDTTDELSTNLNTVADKVRTLTDYVGDLSSIMANAFTIRYGKTEAIDKLTTAWKELRDKIKQAREEIANIQRDITGMQADANILQYQLNIAIKYGDTKRADKLRADIAAKQQEITNKNTEMAKAQGEASTSLMGNSDAAIQNRSTMRGLVQDYNTYLAALANTAQYEGLSDKDVKKKKAFLKLQADQAKADLISKAKAIGFNENELQPYVKTMDDFKTVIDKLPKELTLKVVVDPGTRAFMEWWAANKDNFNPTGGAPTTTSTTGTTGTTSPGKVIGNRNATDTKTGKVIADPGKIVSKINPNAAQKAAKASTSSEGMRSSQKAAYKDFATNMKVLKNDFGGATTLADFARFKPNAKQNERDSFLAALDKYNISKNNATNWGVSAAAMENMFKSSHGKTIANWDTVKQGSTKTEQLSQTVAGKAYLEKQLLKFPTQIAEAIRFLRDRTSRLKSDKDLFNQARTSYTSIKERLGVPGELPWTAVLKNYPGQTSVLDGKTVNIIDYLTPYHDVYNDYWMRIKDNATRGSKYRNLLDNSGYSRTDLLQFFYGDSTWHNNPGNNVGDGFYPLNVNNYATGGHVRGAGTGTSDSIPARLSNGEFVVKASAVRAYGLDFMNSLNQQQINHRYSMPAPVMQSGGAQVVYLSPEDRNLLRAAIERPVNLYTENARIAQSANAGNFILAQRGRN